MSFPGKRSWAGLLLAAALLAPCPAAGGWEHIGNVIHVEALPHGVELRARPASVRVEMVGPSVVRVRLAPTGKFPAEASWAVLPAEAAPPGVTIRETPSATEMEAPGVRVRMQKTPLRISFHDAAGTLIEEDDPARPMAWDGSRVRVWKTMLPEERYYGLGDKPGRMNRRGQSLTLWNSDEFGWQESSDELYKSIPFFLGLRHGVSYGVFFDNNYRSNFDFGKELPDVLSFGAEGGALDYYFIYGPHPKQVFLAYTALTGRTPLPPLWALGYQQCRWSYPSEARVREIARLFRENRIPADVLYLDIDYQDGNRPFTIDRKAFPNFEGMIRDLAAAGFKVVAISDLHLKREPGYAPYDQGIAGDHFVKNPDGSVYVGKVWPGESVFPEFTLTRTREWWGSFYADFVRMGIRGFWNDMNEPAIFDGPGKTMPLGTLHRMDDGTAKDHRAIHNVYGMLNARATFEGLRRLQPDERPFVLTRAAFAGAQRYAASWTGDNTSSWNHLRLTVRTLLSLSVSGYPFVGADVGGFAGSPPPDLLTRWIELGAFLPLYRNHTIKGSADQEPWVHGPEQTAIRRRFIELRYQLLPYLYTSFEETTRTGITLMRPLFLEYPDDDSLVGNVFSGEETEFLFGRDLLVAPKLFEMSDPYEIRLPRGDWYDYWTGQKIPGGQILRATPRLEEMPLYVRAGAILPLQPVVQNTDEPPAGPLQLRVYPGPDCAGAIYSDDGHSMAYVRGASLRVEYSCRPEPGAFELRASARRVSFTPWWKQLRVEVYNIARNPQAVFAANRRLTGWDYDPQQRKLTVVIPDSASGWKLRVNY